MDNVRRKFGPSRWTRAQASTAVVTAAPATATSGVALNPDLRGEYLHIVLIKTASVTIRVWGFAKGIGVTGTWAILDGAITKSLLGPEAEPMQGVGGYDRIAVQITAIAAGTCEIWIGEEV